MFRLLVLHKHLTLLFTGGKVTKLYLPFIRLTVLYLLRHEVPTYIFAKPHPSAFSLILLIIAVETFLPRNFSYKLLKYTYIYCINLNATKHYQWVMMELFPQK